MSTRLDEHHSDWRASENGSSYGPYARNRHFFGTTENFSLQCAEIRNGAMNVQMGDGGNTLQHIDRPIRTKRVFPSTGRRT